MELKQRVKNFIDETGLPLTRFAVRMDLSRDAINKWLHDEMNLKESNLEKIDKWLKSFNR